LVHHHCPNPLPWSPEGLHPPGPRTRPRKSQDVIMILPSLRLGSRQFDASRTDAFFKRYPSRPTLPSVIRPAGYGDGEVRYC
jgi:hypothetical protein